MFKNLGKWDRIMRIAAGAFVVSLMFWGPNSSWGWLGIVLIMTGAIGHCPVYVMLGLKTCKRETDSRAA
jgi:hypothetical protein